MTEYTGSPSYRRCQRLFDRWYPNFRDAGQRYHDLVDERVTEETTILDVGCGQMSLAADTMQGARTVVGIDLDLAALRRNQTVTYAILADAERLPFADHSFDLITSQWAFEHLERPSVVLRDAARVMQRGASMVLFTTNARNILPVFSRAVPPQVQEALIARLLRRPTGETHPTHYRANTAAAIKRLAQHAGLSLKQITYVGNPFYFAFSIIPFFFAMLFEKATDLRPLHVLKFYLLAVLQKEES
ncbi:MAG: class I SAM-dependent methyltransferase [Anaerolineae bacterium]